MVLVVNATKAKKFPARWASNECLLAAFTFFSFYFCRKCNLVYIAKNFAWCYQFGSVPCIPYHISVNGCCNWLCMSACIFIQSSLLEAHD
jgi:hypothetical protein